MRIAQIAPLVESVPPAGYGGTERVIHGLCNGLTSRGHEVTLFATGDSCTRAHLVEVIPYALRRHMTAEEMLYVVPHLQLQMLADVFERAREFDVIHAHTDLWTLPFAAKCDTPTVLTMHGRLDLGEVCQVMPRYGGVALVSISDHQRLPLQHTPLRWAGTVHNGLDLRCYGEIRIPRGEHLVFVGRISPEKGPDLAVEIAHRAGRHLRVAAKVVPLNEAYYHAEIEPLFRSHDVAFIGEIGETEKPAFYAGAAATVFPSNWPEPFGLVMIESMAAGTPVIALRRGAVPELLVDGKTGFICDDVDEMVEAVARIDEIDPDDCRRHAQSFGVEQMCMGYERVYQQVMNTHRAR